MYSERYGYTGIVGEWTRDVVRGGTSATPDNSICYAALRYHPIRQWQHPAETWDYTKNICAHPDPASVRLDFAVWVLTRAARGG